ncbi:hypothetical protein FRC02_001839 [Tulasnella sp. 418]|nr:hypothetical protein FRC02_001839 [Tulasnella sp. 418]
MKLLPLIAVGGIMYLSKNNIPEGIFQSRRQTYDHLNPYPLKPRLVFREDGTFKLSVFSDLHFGENPWDDWGPEQDRKSLIVMNDMLRFEKPDYVAINGDLITGDNTFAENSTTLIDILTRPLTDAGVPFSSAHGNHDNHVNISHLQEITREQEVAPTSYTRRAPVGVGGEGGEGNYWVPIYAHAGDPAPSLIVWFFDSRSGFTPGKGSAPLPDWVDESVAMWLESEIDAMELAWGPSENRAALAFVHVPLHVVESLQPGLDHEKNPGLDDDILGLGSTQSTVDIDKNGENRDKPFWNALTKRVKNLHAVVSGHTHGNEWCAREPNIKQIMCFNKHTGYGGYDKVGWGHGARTFLFHLDNYTSSVDTWITLEDGSTRANVVLNSRYGLDKPAAKPTIANGISSSSSPSPSSTTSSALASSIGMWGIIPFGALALDTFKHALFIFGL